MIAAKKVFLSSVAGAMLLMSGCTQQVAPIPAKEGNVYNTDTVTIDEGGGSGSGAASTGGNSGQGGTIGPDGTFVFNSSADGFQSLYFDFDSYHIKGGAMEAALIRNATIAKQNRNSRIRIEGNCDEFGTDEYNYALGLKRAKAVKDALRMQGVNPSQMVMVSYGESNPACTDVSDACYAQNRRVDLRLVR